MGAGCNRQNRSDLCSLRRSGWENLKFPTEFSDIAIEADCADTVFFSISLIATSSSLKKSKLKGFGCKNFSGIHTLKGTGATIGLMKLESVNHVGENVLSRLRDGKLTLNAEITSALLAMIDASRQIFACLESTGQEGETDLSVVIQTLTAILDRQDELKERAPSGVPSANPPPAPDRLGEIMVKQGVVADTAVSAALEIQQNGDPQPTGEILVRMMLSPKRLYEMEAQTELDKTIIEAIKDPLTHVIRNSLDHGIETPSEREAAGKTRQFQPVSRNPRARAPMGTLLR